MAGGKSMFSIPKAEPIGAGRDDGTAKAYGCVFAGEHAV